MGKDPVNITRLIRLNEKYSNAENYHKSMQKGSQVAGWHENKLKTANAPTKVGLVTEATELRLFLEDLFGTWLCFETPDEHCPG